MIHRADRIGRANKVGRNYLLILIKDIVLKIIFLVIIMLRDNT